jgi:hypothetical protein
MRKYYKIDFFNHNDNKNKKLGSMMFGSLGIRDMLQYMSKEPDIPKETNMIVFIECSKKEFLIAKQNFDSRN